MTEHHAFSSLNTGSSQLGLFTIPYEKIFIIKLEEEEDLLMELTSGWFSGRTHRWNDSPAHHPEYGTPLGPHTPRLCTQWCYLPCRCSAQCRGNGGTSFHSATWEKEGVQVYIVR